MLPEIRMTGGTCQLRLAEEKAPTTGITEGLCSKAHELGELGRMEKEKGNKKKEKYLFLGVRDEPREERRGELSATGR